MIEDKEDGIKIAESKEEAQWVRAKEACESRILNAKMNLECDEELLKFLETKVTQHEKKP